MFTTDKEAERNLAGPNDSKEEKNVTLSIYRYFRSHDFDIEQSHYLATMAILEFTGIVHDANGEKR